MEQKKFILRAGDMHIGYYIGTIEEMSDVLNGFGVEITGIIDITPKIDFGVTYNRAMLTKMKVLGHDTTSQDSFLAEFEQLVKKYSTDGNNRKPKFEYRSVDWFFSDRPISTTAINVLIADDTTFRSSSIDEETGGTIWYLSKRDFEPCSELSEEELWYHLTNFCYYERP